jgi:hypothetical protein
MIGADDDILDALVAAVTAALPPEQQQSLGGEAVDGEMLDGDLNRDLEMRIPAATVSN